MYSEVLSRTVRCYHGQLGAITYSEMHRCAPCVLHEYDWPEPYMNGVYTVFLAGKSPDIRSFTVYKYGSGQPYSFEKHLRVGV